MDDAFRMSKCQPTSCLCDVVDCFLDWQRSSLLDERRQVLTFDVLHDEVCARLSKRPEIVDVDGVRMLEPEQVELVT